MPPPPAVFKAPIPTEQLAFLNDYAGHSEKDLRKDKRFKNLRKLIAPRTEYHYGSDMSLADANDLVLDGDPLPVDIRDGRYVMIGTHGGPYLSGRGFLWFDIQSGIGIGGVYFHPTNGEPTPTLAIYSSQLTDTYLSMGQLPEPFIHDLAQWILVSGVRYVSPRYFIPENGKKYVLVHDEDYCAHPPNTPAPPQDQCQQLNAEAADADMNAAYFMQQTHNQANATAWMLGPDQVAWLSVRDRSCGLGLACRIHITRERTRVLTGGGGGRRR